VSNEPPLPPASPMTVARSGTSRRGVVPTGPTDTVVMVNGDLRTAPTWMDAVLAVQPMPPIESIVIAAAVAAAGVLMPGLWPRTRHLLTIAHEGGHALLALLTGRRLAGIRLHSDTSGLSVSVGRPAGIGMILTLAVGYLTPSVLGLAAAATLATGRVTAMLWGTLLLLAGVLLQIRNFFGLGLLIVTGGIVLAVSYWAPADVQALFGYLLAWFLLLGGVRPVLELARARRSARARTSDADQLARLTRVPAVVWVLLFLVGTVAIAVLGARLLLAGT